LSFNNRFPLRKLIFLGLTATIRQRGTRGFLRPVRRRADQELERKLERSLKTIEVCPTGSRKSSPHAVGVRGLPALSGPGTRTREAHPGDRGRNPSAPDLAQGFADVGANFLGNGGNKGFFDGSLDFYLTPQLSANVKTVIELVFEHEKTGDLAPDLDDAGRLYLQQCGHRLARPLSIRRSATGTPHFTTASSCKTSVLRPQMIDFEDAAA